jgi:beta-hydroxylase
MLFALRRPRFRLRGAVSFRFAKRAVKRVGFLALAVYFIPWVLVWYVVCGLFDVLRNARRTPSTLDRYFFGNGAFTWLLSPFNLLMDLLTVPYRNRGVYRLADLPEGYRAEIQALIDAAHRRDLVGLLEAKLGEKKRGMIFFKWYGKDIATSVDVPEFHHRYRYIRTIGVSIFNKRQSTGKHFGPLRVTLRVLYNVNTTTDPNVYIRVGNHTHHWRDEKLFIFDDTLQHQSCNESDGVRYCLFVDILRPSLVPWLMSGILTGIRLVIVPFRAVFYQHWTFIK